MSPGKLSLENIIILSYFLWVRYPFSNGLHQMQRYQMPSSKSKVINSRHRKKKKIDVLNFQSLHHFVTLPSWQRQDSRSRRRQRTRPLTVASVFPMMDVCVPWTHFSSPVQPGLLRLFTHCKKKEKSLTIDGISNFSSADFRLPAGPSCSQQGVRGRGLKNFKGKIQFSETRVRCGVALRG